MNTFRRFTLFNLVYTLLVILWGAYVRATGSGAGCGEHWPLCNGEVFPRPERIQTAIEFFHRTSSGLSLIFVVIGFFWARKVSTRLDAAHGAFLRKAALVSVIAIFLEAALGAGLVLLKLVEFDQSVMRAISISLHLVNTLFLIASLTTVSWLAFRDKIPQHFSTLFPRAKLFRLTLGVFALLGMAGAVTALGDTLFPSTSLAEGFSQELKSSAHFLLRLRIIHPILAVLWVGLAFVWSQRLEIAELLSIRAIFLGAVVAQFVMGFLNWMLMAPTWLQLMHLLMADLVFISFWVSGLNHEVVKDETRKSS